MKNILLLQTRQGDLAVNERDAIAQYGGIHARTITAINMLDQPFSGLNIHDYCAIIVGGGPFDVSKPMRSKSSLQLAVEATLTDHILQIYQHDIPYLGLCYGLGMLVQALGGVVSNEQSENVQIADIAITKQGSTDNLFSACGATMQAIVGHHESVAQLPKSATLLASSQQCTVQAVRFKNNIYGTQFHPELDVYGLAMRLEAYRHHGYFSPEEFDDIIYSAKQANLEQSHQILQRFCSNYCM